MTALDIELPTDRPHLNCSRPGKFSCGTDVLLNAYLVEGGEMGEGSVSAPAGWFASVDLTERLDDERFVTHYGTRYLIVRELEYGQFLVWAFGLPGARDAVLETLRAENAAWEADQ